jgi:Transposase DDE domain
MLFSTKKRQSKEASMSSRSRDVSSSQSSYSIDLREAISRFLPAIGLVLISASRKQRWTTRMLVVGALFTAWETAVAITDRFHAVCRAIAALWPTRRQPGKSYSGFMKALRRESPGLLSLLVLHLRGHVRRLAQSVPDCWKIGHWAVFGVDGSRIECPMTDANEKAFGTAGKKNTGPQQFLTAIFHVATGLIWAYRRGDARSSERAHLLEMMDSLPPQAMLLADAGFTGYGLLRSILAGGRSFLIRVGSNVHFLTGLGFQCERCGNIVYLWPEKVQKQSLPPLALRLITLPGGKMHLLTNVHDMALLSDEQAEAMYRKRWGIELIYRSLKQTMGRRRMRCASPANAAVELDWAVMALWMLGLLSVSRIIEAGHSPLQWSVAKSLRAVRRSLRTAGNLRGRHREPSLATALASARLDCYVRGGSKKARHWPHKKHEPPPGKPLARKAKESEIQLTARLPPEGIAI